MKGTITLLVLSFVATLSAAAQNISNIILTENESRIAYIKNSDSLFIKELNDSRPEIYVSTGLRENSNQRFLTWSRDGNKLIFEKNKSLIIYDVKKDALTEIDETLLDSLVLFKIWTNTQLGITNNDELIFSGGLKNDPNWQFYLFKLDLKNNQLSKLTSAKDSLEIGNVAVSKDSQYAVYTSYFFDESGSPNSRLSVIRINDNKLVAETEILANMMFVDIKWSPNATKILGRDWRGKFTFLDFNAENSLLEKSEVLVEKGIVPIQFFNETSFIAISRENNQKTYSLFNLNGTKIQELTKERGLSLLKLTENDQQASFLFIQESRIQPISLMSMDMEQSSLSLFYSFSDTNPLSEYAYEEHSYTMGNGEVGSSYIYFQKNSSNQKKRLIIIPYGAYVNRFPNLNYFLYEKLFELLDEGFVLAFVNTRGYANQIQDDEYGKTQLEDTELLINDLLSDYSIEKDKIFLLGHSHGATMVYYYMTHSNLFAGGVAVNGAANWIEQAKLKSMVGLPGAMGGSPDSLQQKYNEYSPIENIDYLNSPMLVFAGKKDTQIPFHFNTDSFYTKAKALGKTIDIQLYENEAHLIKDSYNRKIFWDKIFAFLKNN